MQIDQRLVFVAGAAASFYATQAAISYLVNGSPAWHKAFKERWLTPKLEDPTEVIFVKATLLAAASCIAIATITGRVQHHDQWQCIDTIKKIVFLSLMSGILCAANHQLATHTETT